MRRAKLVVPVLFPLVLTALLAPSETLAQGPPGKRVVWVWKKAVDCPDPCPQEAACTFEVRFAYNERREAGGTIFIDAFDVEFRKAAADDCEAQFERGRGTFRWTCGDKNCELTAENVRKCPCGSEVQFEDLNPTDEQSCHCTTEPPTVVPGPPACGDPRTIDVLCPKGIGEIEIDATHDLICKCKRREVAPNTGTLNWQVKFGGAAGRKRPPVTDSSTRDRPKREPRE